MALVYAFVCAMVIVGTCVSIRRFTNLYRGIGDIHAFRLAIGIQRLSKILVITFAIAFCFLALAIGIRWLFDDRILTSLAGCLPLGILLGLKVMLWIECIRVILESHRRGE